MARVFVGIGSNEGDRLANVSLAVRWLGQHPDLKVAQLATVQETKPVGGPPQGPFLNTVVTVETARRPRELLGILQQIEGKLGRRPGGPRMGPRPIDLDILLYDDEVITEEGLMIPHVRLHTRRFVLEPFAQLAPAVMHPVLRRTIAELLQALPDLPSASTS